MADAQSRAELIERLRNLDRADLDAVLRAARTPTDEPAARAAPVAQLTNAGRTALVVETGDQAGVGLGPSRALDLAIEQPVRAFAPASGGADRPPFGGAVRAVVAVRIRPREAGAGSARLGLVAWRHEAARFGWPTVLARTFGDEPTQATKRTKSASKRGPRRPQPEWRLIASDPATVDVAEAGIEVLVVGIGPDLGDIAEPFAALVRAAGDTDTSA